MEPTIKNAVIESASIDDGDRGLLTAWLFLNHDSGTQGFGGYALYLPKDYINHKTGGNFAGHFIWRVMKIAGVTRWEDLVGKTVRIKQEHSRIHAIGHIVDDDWFNPSEDFKEENS